MVFVWNSALRGAFGRYLGGLFASIGVVLVLAGGGGAWALGYHSMEFRYFPNIS